MKYIISIAIVLLFFSVLAIAIYIEIKDDF